MNSKTMFAGYSPSHCGHTSGVNTMGIRLCSRAHNSFGTVVTIVNLRMRSPAGERQVSHNPAIAISRRP
jgi:hypothetical protein